MPHYCAVVGFKNTHTKDGEKRFYSFPTVRTREGQETAKLSARRRRSWVQALGRRGLEEKTIRPHYKVCSDDFISVKLC